MSLHEVERKKLDEEWRIEREKRSSDRLFEQKLFESRQRFEETRAQIVGEGSNFLESRSPLSSVGLSQHNERVGSWVQNSAAHSQIERRGSPPGPKRLDASCSQSPLRHPPIKEKDKSKKSESVMRNGFCVPPICPAFSLLKRNMGALEHLSRTVPG
jgi:hypothetical protein